MSKNDKNDQMKTQNRRQFLKQMATIVGTGSAFSIFPASLFGEEEKRLKLKGSNTEGIHLKDVGFWDEGFITGRVRTDYNSSMKGASGNPLTLSPCLYTGNDPMIIPAGASWGGSGCAMSPTVYPQSNSYSNSPWPKNNFWILSINNEPAYQTHFNSGPPNQSLAISKPGKGIIGFDIEKNNKPNKNSLRAQLALDHSFAPSGSEGYIPFLGIGAHKNRGNGKPISLLNPSLSNVPQKVTFKAKMQKNRNITQKGTAGFFWFIASAEWGGIPRMVFVALYHNVPERGASKNKFIHGHWNWNIKESFYYPGGDLIYMHAEDLNSVGIDIPQITSAGREYSYGIDLQKLFETASSNGYGVTFDTPLPKSKDIPVTGMHWAVEMTGKDTALWFSVYGMKMV